MAEQCSTSRRGLRNHPSAAYQPTGCLTQMRRKRTWRRIGRNVDREDRGGVGGLLSFFWYSGGAGTGEEYRFISFAQRRGVQVTVGSVACDARIAIRADQPLCFGHLGDGEAPFRL